jgi:hypothetical protein
MTGGSNKVGVNARSNELRSSHVSALMACCETNCCQALLGIGL